MAVKDGILDTTKVALGIFPDDHTFDGVITMHINSVFATIAQLGFGPEVPFFIDDLDETWDMFVQDRLEINSVRTYMALKVRMMFDPPTIGVVMAALEKNITEAEVRLNIAGETP